MSKFFICLSLTEEGKEKNISVILNSFYVLLTELNSDPDLHQNKNWESDPHQIVMDPPH